MDKSARVLPSWSGQSGVSAYYQLASFIAIESDANFEDPAPADDSYTYAQLDIMMADELADGSNGRMGVFMGKPVLIDPGM